MKTTLDRIASLLAFGIGAAAVFAGGKTLIGKIPNWSVLSWLPLYNYTLGLLIVLIVAPLLWKGSRLSGPTAIVTLGINTAVLILLETAFAAKVAPESIQAMILRVAVWLVISVLIIIGSRWRISTAQAHIRGESAENHLLK